MPLVHKGSWNLPGGERLVRLQTGLAAWELCLCHLPSSWDCKGLPKCPGEIDYTWS